MQTSDDGWLMLAGDVGYFIGIAITTSLCVVLETLLPPVVRTVVLILIAMHWLTSTFTPNGPLWTYFFQLLKCCTLIRLVYYFKGIDHGLIVFLGIYLLFGKVVKQFIVYLKTEGPPGEELFAYIKMKHMILEYAGTALFLIRFRAIIGFIHRIIWASVAFGICDVPFWVGITSLVWEKRWECQVIVLTLIVKLSLTTLYVWDRIEMLEGMVLFWLPRVVSILCEWIERKCSMKRNIQFQYSSCTLDGSKHEIRLLRLEKRGIFSGIIKAEIMSVSVDDPPPYEALSYCWGKSTIKKPILLNGAMLLVPPSAYALLFARSSYFKEQLLWIDAICINQDDIDERSTQVQMMRQIYENSSRVIAWPGDCSKSRLAAAMVWDLYGTSLRFKGSPSDFRDWFWNERYSPRWLALLEFLKSPYFSRVWVLQEVAVAQDVQVLLGGVYIPWNILVEVMIDLLHPQRRSLLTHTTDPENNSYYQSSSSGNFETILVMRFLNEKHGRVPDYERLPLGKLLTFCTKFQATNPRDHVFALVGLARKASPPLIDVEYSDTVQQVYITSTLRIFSQDGMDFGVLASAGIGFPRSSELLSLPSWVPDWSSTWVTFTLASMDVYHTSTSAPTFACTLSTPFSILSIHGFLIDTITATTSTLYTNRPSGVISIEDYSNTIHGWHQEAFALSKSMGEDPVRTHEMFWRTLVGDKGLENSRPAPLTFAQYYTNWATRIAILRAAGSRARLEANIRSGELAANLISESENDGIREFQASFGDVCIGRRLCVTKNDRMGLVAPGTEIGDIVVVFEGASTPFIVRKCTCDGCEGCWRLVGEAYIHGMMDGVNCEEKESHTFKLI